MRFDRNIEGTNFSAGNRGIDVRHCNLTKPETSKHCLETIKEVGHFFEDFKFFDIQTSKSLVVAVMFLIQGYQMEVRFLSALYFFCETEAVENQ